MEGSFLTVYSPSRAPLKLGAMQLDYVFKMAFNGAYLFGKTMPEHHQQIHCIV